MNVWRTPLSNTLELLKSRINWSELPYIADPECKLTAQARYYYSMTEKICPMCGKPMSWMPSTRRIDAKADVHEIVSRSAFGVHALARQHGAINLVPYALRVGVCHECNINRRPDNYNGRFACTRVKILHLGVDIVDAAVTTLNNKFGSILEVYLQPIREAIQNAKEST